MRWIFHKNLQLWHTESQLNHDAARHRFPTVLGAAVHPSNGLKCLPRTARMWLSPHKAHKVLSRKATIAKRGVRDSVG